ncbi:putative ABC transporter ATP-binding protein [Solidesulfovibrio magneticus RS-1]|uniref:ABC transporter ATP-binding protein n=2 Tax=Solidesulfovibrio TaxID=2910984 RepID=C4XUG3_SOLM1|nr:putative ABC transporter ATP-binding protein [Solidesulfovibrio magneticus RS-1]
MRIELQNASVTLSGAKALSDVSLTLAAGETLLVLGANGSGKSTLLRLLRGDIWPDDDGRGSRLYAAGHGPGRASPIGVRHRFAVISPELQRTVKRLWGHLDATTVILSGPRDAMYVQAPPTPAERAALEEALTRLGIDHLRDTPVGTLSNGQLRAVLLARGLACRPTVLFLDEFLDGLDAAAAVTASQAMAAAAASGAAIVLTSHTGAGLPPGPARGLVLAGGRVVHEGSAESAREHHARTIAGCLETVLPAQNPECALADGAGAHEASGLPLVIVENASVFLDRREILRSVNLAVAPGGHLAVVGANGSGKSTLLKLMAGEHHPALGGRVSRPGLAAPEGLTDLRDIRRRIGLASFELEADYDKEISALEVALSGSQASIGLYVEPTDRELRAAQRWMAFFGVAKLAGRKLGALSAGQTRRLFLARAMAAEPRLLLLDEPFSGLDAASRRAAMEAVSAAARSGVTVVCAVHRPEDVIPEIRAVARIKDGRVSLAGPGAAFP